jgi:hypothetical protein
MFELDPMVAAAIFLSSFFLDLIAARYTSDVVSLRAGRAASLSFLWHMLSAIVVIQYAHNAFYILFVCLGGGLGTYFTIWSTRRGGAATDAPAPVVEDAAPAVAEGFVPALSRRPRARGAMRRAYPRRARRGASPRRYAAPGGRTSTDGGARQ